MFFRIARVFYFAPLIIYFARLILYLASVIFYLASMISTFARVISHLAWVILAAGSASKSPLKIKSSGLLNFGKKYKYDKYLSAQQRAANEVTMYSIQ
jgi:hypothetical protein